MNNNHVRAHGDGMNRIVKHLLGCICLPISAYAGLISGTFIAEAYYKLFLA